MTFTLQRDVTIGPSLFGALVVGGAFFSFTLENAALAIPAGVYGVKLYYSIRNQMIVPLLEQVPGRTFIEIHPANHASELKGCIAPGLARAGVTIEHSRAAVEGLIKVLRGYLKSEPVWIDIRDARGESV